MKHPLDSFRFVLRNEMVNASSGDLRYGCIKKKPSNALGALVDGCPSLDATGLLDVKVSDIRSS
jgi:hypothetical protein